jgi:hypothetical protein
MTSEVSMIIKCPKCGTQNRIPDTPEPSRRYICGKCKAVLTDVGRVSKVPSDSSTSQPSISKEIQKDVSVKRHTWRRSLVVHPLFLAMFPILAVYAHNMHELSISEVVLPLVFAAGMTFIIFLFSWLILKNSVKAGIIVTIFVALFFSYGHFVDLLGVGDDGFVLFCIWIPLLIVGIYLTLKTRRDLANLTSILNVIAIVLVLIPAINILSYEIRRPSVSLDKITPAMTGNVTQSDGLPDIYYIILDGYSRADTLKDSYDFDNSEFVNYLSSKGFHVTSQSRSNYNLTTQSIPSSLNMEFVNYLSDTPGKGTTDVSLLWEICQNNKVAQFLKSKGYEYLQVASYWKLTGPTKLADINFTPFPVTEFNQILYRTTMLRVLPFLPKGLDYISDRFLAQWTCAMNQFKYLAKMPELRQDIEEPIFVFAHITIPHPPFAIDEDGTFITEEEAARRTREENYLNQIMFCNTKVKMLVDKIIGQSRVPPVIIIQADHGLGDTAFSGWGDLSEEDQIRMRMRILNAYYLPKDGSDPFYESITPVNTFRLLFNLYFSANYELLPDNSYWSNLHGQTCSKLRDVTEFLRE